MQKCILVLEEAVAEKTLLASPAPPSKRPRVEQ